MRVITLRVIIIGSRYGGCSLPNSNLHAGHVSLELARLDLFTGCGLKE